MSALLSLALAPLFSYATLFSYAIPQDAAPPAAAPVPAAPAPAAPTGTPEAKAALAAAMKALTETGSYSFELKTEGSGGGGRGGRGGGGGGEGGGGGGDQTPPPPAKIQFEKGLPMHMQRGDMQAFVQGDVIVYFDTEKQTWEKLDPAAMRGGRGGRGPGGGEGGGAGGAGAGGAGGDGGGAAPTPPTGGATGGAAGGAAGGSEPAPPAGGATPTPPTGGAASGGDATPTPPGGGAAGEGGERRGGGRSGFGRTRDLLGVARAQPPHLVLGDIETSASDVSQSDVDGKVILKGTLSKDAAEKIASAGFGGRGGFGGGGGGDGPERESSGSFEATLDGQGQLVALVVDTKMKMSFGDREFERTTKHSYTLADFGAVKIEVPESALVHFEF